MSDTLIDFYCHISPERFLQEMNKFGAKLGNIGARLRGVQKIHDLDARFKEMDQFGDYRQVISLPNPPIEDFATPGQGLALAHVANDAMAELCTKHPDRFAGFVEGVQSLLFAMHIVCDQGISREQDLGRAAEVFLQPYLLHLRKVLLEPQDSMTLPIAMDMLRGYLGSGNLAVVMAAMSMAVLPVILLFLMAQKMVIEGVTMSGIKN